MTAAIAGEENIEENTERKKSENSAQWRRYRTISEMKIKLM